MSENHELRLKIDAAAAKTGANEFQAAINAVKKAVQDLERDSTGAFTKLTKSISSVGALGKMKLPGVDSRTLSDLDSFAKLQVAAGKAIANTSKVAQQAVSVLSGLRTSYAAARKDVDSFNTSLTKVNATLARQAQLAGQSKPSSRTTSKAETVAAPSGLPSSEALAAIIRLYNEIGIAGMRAGSQAASGSTAAATAAQAQVKAAADAARAAALQERLELASAAAMRSASLEAARLRDRLQGIGDTSSARTMTSALLTLEATLSGGVGSFNALKSAVNEFANSAASAKMILIATESAQRQSASAAAALAQQNRTIASTSAEAASAAAAQAKAMGDAARAAAMQEKLESAAASAMRSATVEAARLTDRLQRIGDTSGVTAVNNALNNLKATAGSGSATFATLRTAVGEFSNASSAAKVALIAYDGAQRQAAATARELAAQNRAAATSASESASAANNQAKAISDAARAAALQERLQASSAAAMRSATLEAARLTERLQRIGDTSGIVSLTAALNNLRSSASSDTATFGSLRTAVSEFANATTNAKAALIASDGAQRQAASAARDLATQNRAATSSAQQIEREMRSISGASNAVSQSLAKATGNMRGLENAFSSTFQVGSLFRNMLGSITLGTFTKNVFEAGNALDQFRVTMEVASGSAAAASNEMQFVDDMTRKLGTNLLSARDSYSKFAISSNLAGVSSKDTQNIFESVSMALSVLGKGTEDQNLSFLALEQMMSKGTLSSEELRRQLGERLPGAVNLMAKALGVTTIELQKMLKAGTIQSADALPKFAAQLQKEFGPGLQNAVKRAGFSLGTMQGELQRLMETVAQSGFMQVLAEQFTRLTAALQSDGAREAAVKLGEGFATMAKLGGDALLFISSHVNEVGSIIKAVFRGIIISQFLAFGGAVVGSIQQMSAMKSAWITWRASVSATTVATTANAGALRADTIALEANALASSEAALAARGLASAKGAQGLTGIATAAKAIGGATGALGLLSRGLGLLGPVAMAASVALTVIPMMLGDIGHAAEISSQQLEAALNRAGVSLDKFKGDSAKSASLINLQQNLADLDTFKNAVDAFRKSTLDKPVNMLGNTALNAQDSLANMKDVAQGKDPQKKTDWASGELWANPFGKTGVEADAFDKMSKSGKDATAEIVDMTQAAIAGQGSFIELYGAISKALTIHPDASGVLSPLQTWISTMATAEMGTVELKNRLTNLYGTDDQKFLKTFVDAATVVATTGDGMQDLNDKIAEAQKNSPQLVATLQQIKSDAQAALTAGMSGAEFAMKEQPTYFRGSAAEKILTAQAQIKQANDQVAASAGQMSVAFNNALDAVGQQFGTTTVEYQNVLEMLLKVKQERESFKDAPIAPKDIGAQFNSVKYASPQATTEMKAYTDEVMRQYNALKPLEQTYSHLRGIMDSVAQVQTAAGVNLGGYVGGLAELARQNRVVGSSTLDMVTDFKTIATAYGFQGTQLSALLSIVTTAAGTNDAWSRSAVGAAGSMNTATSAAFAIAGGASAGVSAINSLIAALRNLFGMGAGIASSGIGIVNDIQTQIAIAKAKGSDKAVLQFWAGSDGQKFENESKAAIATAQAEAASATTVAGRLAANAKAAFGIAALAMTHGAIDAKTRELYTAQQDAKPPKTGGASGAPNLIDDKKVFKDITERAQALERDNAALQAQIDSTYKSKEAAKLFGEAMVAGGGAVDSNTLALLDQIDAAAKLNDQLTRLADDPIKKYIDSVPDYIDASHKIKQSILDGMTTGLSDFFMTGKSDLKAFVDSIRSTMAGILAQQTIGWGMKKLGMGGPQGSGASVAAGGQQAGGFIHNAMVSAGQIVSNLLHGSLTAGARTAGATVQSGVVAGGQSAAMASRVAGSSNAMQTTVAGTQAGMAMGQGVVTGATAGAPILGAGVAAGAAGGAAAGAVGGGGGGLIMGAISLISGLFSEGGYSDGRAMKSMSISPAAFHSAPHYKEGTANTTGGGIPAILHPNEAVIPLSRGRKIPVEMSGKPSPSENVTSMTMGDIHVSIVTDNVGDANQAAAAADQIANMVALRVQEEMAKQMRYGGIMNPRGR